MVEEQALPTIGVGGSSAVATEAGILILGFQGSAAGMNRSACEDLADHLLAQGWPVITASRKQHRVARLLDMIHTSWAKRNEYTVAHVDIFSGLAFIWGFSVCQILRLLGKPYILTLRGGNLPPFSARHPRVVEHLLHSAAVVTTPSAYLYKQMKQYHPSLCLVPNALDISTYPRRIRTHPQPHLVWLRAFHEIYNPSMAPRVVALLAPQFHDLHLIMIGPDKGDCSLQGTEKVANELGVRERLSLPGGVLKADVPNWLNKADIFLNTTNIDNTPISVMEAMACGLCVVSTNVGGIPYLLEHEHDALLVPPDDPQAMSSAVQRILTEPGLAERLSLNARQKAEQFDWEVILPQWELLLRTVARIELR